MKKLLFSALLICSGAAIAASNLVGTYTCKGTNHGVNYFGNMRINSYPNTSIVGVTEKFSKSYVSGYGFFTKDNRVLTVAFKTQQAPNAVDYVASYTIYDQGRLLDGRWLTPNSGKAGAEVCQKV